jgi:hypothetical protein
MKVENHRQLSTVIQISLSDTKSTEVQFQWVSIDLESGVRFELKVTAGTLFFTLTPDIQEFFFFYSIKNCSVADRLQ